MEPGLLVMYGVKKKSECNDSYLRGCECSWREETNEDEKAGLMKEPFVLL